MTTHATHTLTTPGAAPSMISAINHMPSTHKSPPLSHSHSCRSKEALITTTAATTATTTTTTTATTTQQQPAFVRPFEDSFRVTSKPQQQRAVLTSHNHSISSQINHQESMSIKSSASNSCSATQSVTAQSVQDSSSDNCVGKAAAIVSTSHQLTSAQSVQPYSTAQFHLPHIPVSHVPSLYKPPHFTPPSSHQQQSQHHGSSKLNVNALNASNGGSATGNVSSTKLQQQQQHHASETTQVPAGGQQRNDSAQTNVNNNCIVVDKTMANSNHYYSNSHVTAGAAKVVNSNHKTNNSDNVTRDNKVNVNSEKSTSENQNRQLQASHNHSTVGSLVEKPALPHLTYDQAKGPTVQPLSFGPNDKICKSEIDAKPQVDQSIILSTLPFQPAVKFNLNEIAQKPIDTAQLMQSIKSEEVLRTCQNVSNVLLQIPKYQEKLLNFSGGELKTAFCFTDKCNNLTEISVKCEPPVLNVPDLSKTLLKQEIVSETSFLVPDKPKELTSTLDLAEKRRKRRRERSTGIAASSDSEGEEETKDVDLWITKGPPAKPQYSDKKLSFLGMFGLTTLTTRNEIELYKVEKRYRLNPDPLEPPLESEPTVESVLPIPQEHPDVLLHTPDFAPKVGFLKTIGLDVMPPNKRDEAEITWQYILQDRKKRKSMNTVTAYCERIAKVYTQSSPPLPKHPQKMRLLDRVKVKHVPERPPPLPPLVPNIVSMHYPILPMPGENGVKHHCKIVDVWQDGEDVVEEKKDTARWNGIEDIMLAYREYSKEKTTERKVLTEQMSKMAAQSNGLRSEAIQLERRRYELLSTRSALENERRALSEKIERINALVRTLR